MTLRPMCQWFAGVWPKAANCHAVHGLAFQNLDLHVVLFRMSVRFVPWLWATQLTYSKLLHPSDSDVQKTGSMHDDGCSSSVAISAGLLEQRGPVTRPEWLLAP